MKHRLLRLLVAGFVAVSACGGAAQTTTPTSAAAPAIKLTATPALSKNDLGTLAAAFPDAPFSGGQVAPFVVTMVTDSTFVFVQFDKPKVNDATGVAYLGLGVKGTFCSETQPDRTDGSFPVFRQASAPSWASGLGGKPGAAGYWLSYVAADKLTVGTRTVDIGIDYQIGVQDTFLSEVRLFLETDAAALNDPNSKATWRIWRLDLLRGRQFPPSHGGPRGGQMRTAPI